ncbi:MAG: response regulator [Desulfobacterales bacterium]|nr:response regulator [Desulfobacterales bacterium]
MAKILVVDDDQIVRYILTDILESHEYYIETAKDGEDAIGKFAKDFDLIIVDMKMPKLGGIDLIKELKSDIPFIVLTGSDDVTDAIKAMNNGASDYILKDGNIENTVPLSVARVLERQQIREENLRLMRDLENKNKELEKALKEIERGQEQLVQSAKMASLGELVTGVAHEINTPIGIGVGAASHLAKITYEIISSFENEKMKKSDLKKYFSFAKDYSELMLANLKRAGELVSSFKKISADQTSQDKRLFNVKSYLDEVILTLKPELKKTAHEIEINCPEHIEINSFPGAIAQVMTNLVMNSMIHAYEKEDKGKIRINVSLRQDDILLEYSDDGKGIPQAHLGRIFNPFFTTKRGHGGTGLGLNIVFNIVHSTLKGSISCESAENIETKFIITIPRLIDD